MYNTVLVPIEITNKNNVIIRNRHTTQRPPSDPRPLPRSTPVLHFNLILLVHKWVSGAVHARAEDASNSLNCYIEVMVTHSHTRPKYGGIFSCVSASLTRGKGRCLTSNEFSDNSIDVLRWWGSRRWWADVLLALTNSEYHYNYKTMKGPSDKLFVMFPITIEL